MQGPPPAGCGALDLGTSAAGLWGPPGGLLVDLDHVPGAHILLSILGEETEEGRPRGGSIWPQSM